jgi:ParB-like chromosome segregation protein Spo0J
MIPVEKVKPNEWNAIELPAESEAILKQQMKAGGPEKTEAITVRKVGENWEIINGEKRWRIAKQLGWTHIPAVEIEASTYESKKYCLSYNLLRGTVNYVKLSNLLMKDEEMVKVCREIMGDEKTEELIESGKRLTKKAEEILAGAVKEGAAITPEKMKIVAEAPPQHQDLLARAAKQAGAETYYMMAMKQRYAHPEEGETGEPLEEEAEAETEEEAEEEAGREVRGVEEGEGEVEAEETVEAGTEEIIKKVKEKLEKEVSGRAAEIESFIDLNGQVFRIFYNPEKKKVGIEGTTMSTEDFDAYADEFMAPKLYAFEFRCECGRRWIGQFDASDGQYSFRKAEK